MIGWRISTQEEITSIESLILNKIKDMIRPTYELNYTPEP